MGVWHQSHAHTKLESVRDYMVETTKPKSYKQWQLPNEYLH